MFNGMELQGFGPKKRQGQESGQEGPMGVGWAQADAGEGG